VRALVRRRASRQAWILVRIGSRYSRSWSLRNPGRIGRGQIQGHIVGDGRDSRKAELVVIASILNRSVAILADVHATDSRELPASQVFYQAIDAKIVEAEVVHQGAIGRITEQARLGICRLRSRSDGAYFDEAEADCGKAVDADSIFVEPGGYPDSVRKAQSEQRDRLARVIARDRPRDAAFPDDPKGVDRDRMRELGRHCEQEGSEEFV